MGRCYDTPMRTVLAFLMLVHAVPHLSGFLRLAATPGNERIVGVLWLLTAIAFWVAAYGALRGRAWWLPLTAATAAVSLALCLAAWPDASIGAAIDVAILAALAVDRGRAVANARR